MCADSAVSEQRLSLDHDTYGKTFSYSYNLIEEIEEEGGGRSEGLEQV